MSDNTVLPYIDHVIDGVYIGSARAIWGADELRQANLKHVLKLYFYEPHWPKDFVVCDNPIIDGERVPTAALERGVKFVREQVEAGRPVLVQCGAGISRSSTFVLGYMIEAGHELRAAYKLLREQHPAAWPLPAMWLSLIEHYQLPYSSNDVLTWQFER